MIRSQQVTDDSTLVYLLKKLRTRLKRRHAQHLRRGVYLNLQDASAADLLACERILRIMQEEERPRH